MKANQYAGAVIRFRGIVQGVGFRPFVFRSAHRLHLKGSVQNTGTGVLIRIDGEKKNIECFYEEIRVNPPVLAEIHESSLSFCSPHGFQNFAIVKSTERLQGFTPVSPDIATCEECIQDVFDPTNRRFMYPFTNCTNCGPRFTIIRDIPYDRKNTTMSIFPMCSECNTEYENPLDRRYHAQPNACPVCGPSLTLMLADGSAVAGEPIQSAVKMLEDGKIVAVKGLGGFHLAVDPRNHEAVKLLRLRKKRRGKPFALMIKDLETVKKFCSISERDEALLGFFERPIVLLERLWDAPVLSSEVAPDTTTYGILLPYTPLHHILLDKGPDVLVMTSANLSEEPLVFNNQDALHQLAGIADAFLIHDREIERPCDDSVILSLGEMAVPIRRSRGFVPRAIDIGDHKHQVFAAGALEKNTFCVIKEGKAYPSHHIGDLDNEKSVDAYNHGVQDFFKMFHIKPDAVACDLHPDYVSTRFAEDLAQKLGVPLYYVQHHHAHIASVLGEHKCEDRVIGVAFDGTGYGSDGTIWGGEFLVASGEGYERVGHFAPVPMPGGEKSILETDRMALSYLILAYGSLSSVPSFKFFEDFDHTRMSFIEKIISLSSERSGIGQYCPLTSSCGRLFDAVSSMLGLCSRPAYDAQGAILLETEAHDFKNLLPSYSYSINERGVLDFGVMIQEIVEDIIKGEAGEKISQRFHSTIVVAAVDMCMRIREDTCINRVAFSGGVFQNRHIVTYLIRQLREKGFTVLYHRLVPPNDGGISLGQGIVALNTLRGGSG